MKLKAQFYIGALLVITGTFPGMNQNLILNPSFEDASVCPWEQSQTHFFVDSIDYWYTPGQGSSDYHHSCSGHANADVHNEPPFHGDAYAGFFSCGHMGGCAAGVAQPYKEYIGGTLSSALSAGQNYKFRIWVSCSDDYNCTNNLGVYFSATQPSIAHCEEATSITPQIDFGMITPTKTGWTLYEDIYSATGGEQYFIIGGFSGTCNMTYMYYYVDSLSLVPVSVLPVEFTEFSGWANNGGNHLYWTTASEVNNDYYTIERSDDGIYFENIGIQQGKGTTNTISYYNYTDLRPNSFKSYYRLKQVDYNGSFSYSKTVHIESGNSSAGIPERIFISDQTENITFQIPSGCTSYILYNTHGQVIRKEQVQTNADNKFSISKGSLSEGVYIVKWH